MVERLEIAWSKKFVHQLDGQLNILYREKRFGSQQEVSVLADKVYDFVIENVEKGISTPEKYKEFGEKYIRYMVDDTNTWYIFFDQQQSRLLTTHLLNNSNSDIAEVLQ
ncbi:MAG: hypothetical protein KBA33_06100 [Cloacibacterium sp.]|nr:hypothetical protein [Cloacibacterium sp.]